MLCNKCGFEMTDGLTVCPNCGEEVQASAVAEEAVPEQAEPTPAQPKKKKTGLVLGIIGGVLAVAAVLVAVFFGQIEGFVIKTFGDGQDYFRYVAGNTFETYADGATEIYGAYLDGAEEENVAAEAELKLVVNHVAKDDICEYLGQEINMDWLNRIALVVDYNSKDGVYASSAKLKIGNTDIVGLDMIEDTNNNAAYLALLNLSDKYLSIKGDELYEQLLIDQGIYELLDDEEFLQILPTEEEFNELLNKYFDIVIKKVDNVKKSEKTVTYNDITRDLTLLELEINTEDAAKISKALLEEARDDKVIKKYINDIAKYLEKEEIVTDADEVYTQYVDSIDEALTAIEEADGDNEVLFNANIYVNSAHEIVGLDVTEDEETVFGYLVLTKDKTVAVRAALGEVVIGGKGERTEDLLNMDITVEKGRFTIMEGTVSDLKLQDLANGRLNCRVDMDFKRGMYEKEALPYVHIKRYMEQEWGLEMVFKTEEKTASATISVVSKKGVSEKEVYAGVELTVKEKDAEKVVLPSEDRTVAYENADQWLFSFDITKITEAMGEAKVPKNAILIIESIINPAPEIEEWEDEEWDDEYWDDEYWDDEYWDDEYWDDFDI